MKTLTGKTLDEVREIMVKHLEPQAYSEVGGAAYLTDINPAYLREALTEAFGLCGAGWSFDYQSEDIVIVGGDRPEAFIKRAELKYLIVEDDGATVWSEPIIGMGGSDNRKIGDAIKGAVTQALGKAASLLLWQADVYKGKLSHKNAGQAAKAPQGKPQASQDGGHKRSGDPLDAERVREYLTKKVGTIGEYNASDKFRNFVRGQMGQLFPESQDADSDVHSVLAYLFVTTTSKDLTGAQVMALRDWIDPAPNDEGKVVPNVIAQAEAKAILTARMKEAGQVDLPLE